MLLFRIENNLHPYKDIFILRYLPHLFLPNRR
jgi:hypothetical protein